MVYCKNCDQQIKGERKWGWAAFLTLMILGGLGIFYPFYCHFKTKTCPICNDNNWKEKKSVRKEKGEKPAWKNS